MKEEIALLQLNGKTFKRAHERGKVHLKKEILLKCRSPLTQRSLYLSCSRLHRLIASFFLPAPLQQPRIRSIDCVVVLARLSYFLYSYSLSWAFYPLDLPPIEPYASWAFPLVGFVHLGPSPSGDHILRACTAMPGRYSCVI